MSENLKEKVTPRNPLGIIALFVSFIEAVATVSLKFVADAKVNSLLWVLVSFIILYPTFIAIAFFAILLKKREILFGPMDFADPKGFENILLRKVERIEAKQDAARLDVDAALSDVLAAINKLIELNDIHSAVTVGRAYLKQNEFDKSIEIFRHILTKISESHELYYKVIANLAYSLIGKRQFEEAIKYLLEVKSFRKGRNFYAWHAIALAYAYYRIGEMDEYQKWLAHAKTRREYELDVDFFSRLYPEIRNDLRNL